MRKGRFASTVAESEGEQDSALDSESQLDDVDGDARSGKSAKLSRLRRGGAVEVEEDEVAGEEDASLAEGVGEE